MKSAIDAAGRIVIPKAVRDAAQLRPGTPIDVVFVDGRIEIDFRPLEAVVQQRAGMPVIVPASEPPELSDSIVRDTLESTRR